MVNTIVPVNYPVTNSPNNVSDVQRVAEKLLNRDVSPNTLKALASDMRYFFKWYSDKNGEEFSFERVLQRDVIDFRDDMQRNDLKPATVNRRLVNVRLLLKTAVELEIISKNHAEDVKQIASQSLAPKGLTEQETRKFLKECELHGTLRDKMVIHLLLSAGLRASEVIGLTIKDVEITERKGHVTIRRAKGNKQRVVPLGSRLRELITGYMIIEGPTENLVLGQRGAITQFALNKLVGKYAAKAGLKVHPHTLRHVFAFQYLQKNPGDIVGLSQLLGHSSISTTQIYTQNRLEDLAERMEAVVF